jgi:uncharacterized protein (DUF58 family)
VEKGGQAESVPPDSRAAPVFSGTCKPRPLFIPLTQGIFMFLLFILSFIAGTIRKELALTLIGTALLAVWIYCLVMTLFLALIHKRRGVNISARLSPPEINTGEEVRIGFGRSRFLRLPGILIRCRLVLSTRDGRFIRYDFDPDTRGDSLRIEKRGAYFSGFDEFAVFDALGFFRFAWRVPRDTESRLLVCPRAAGESLSLKVPSGGTERRSDLNFQRSDNLINHRPYVPGDDPRRINWKLYGHGGELFVREGEPEPPPHSGLFIFIDTQADPALFPAEGGAAAVDTLCENALTAAGAFIDSGMDVQMGWTGETKIRGTSDKAEIAAALALPAALPLARHGNKAEELPEPPGDRGILIFALPRIWTESPALDRFLKSAANRRKNKEQSVELLFFYSGEWTRNGAAYSGRSIETAAETCVSFYNHRAGISARCFREA